MFCSKSHGWDKIYTSCLALVEIELKIYGIKMVQMCLSLYDKHVTFGQLFCSLFEFSQEFWTVQFKICENYFALVEGICHAELRKVFLFCLRINIVSFTD